MARLFIQAGKQKDKFQPVTLSESNSIGRGKPNQISINDTSVSRRHARIARAADGFFHIYDLGSSNGTYVNNRKVTDQMLKNKDRILIGDILCIYNERPSQDWKKT